MLILLPPSESKSAPRRGGAPIDLSSLSFPELTEHRATLVDALVRLAKGPLEDARRTLRLTARQDAEVERDAVLLEAPTARVSELYTGVLYDALDLRSLTGAAKRRATTRLVVASALFGALRPNDRVPPYRLSAGVDLPEVGGVGASWRVPLAAALPAAAGRRGLVLDLRSSSYAAMWRPDPGLADRTVTVRVLHEREPGDPSSRQVVSHFNKATKGRLVRHLLETGDDPRTAEELAELLTGSGATAELAPPRPDKPRSLDLVVLEL